MLCSEWVPSEWESKQLIKRHNNTQVIHTTPVHQLMSCEEKNCVFERNKSIMLLSPVKESSRLNQERNPHRSSKPKTDLHKSLGGLWCERTKGWTFSLEEALFWFILTRRNGFKLKTYWWIKTCSFSLHKTLTDGLCGLLRCFYQLFGLSFWRHPFTAEHPLMNKWCNATFLQIWWRKTHILMDDLRVSTFWHIVICGWIIPWNCLFKWPMTDL